MATNGLFPVNVTSTAPPEPPRADEQGNSWSRSHFIGIAAGIGAAFSWGSATVVSKALLQDFNPVSLLLIQLASSVALLWCLVLWRMKRAGSEAPSLGGVAAYAWLGAMEPGLAYLLCLCGLLGMTASGATLIQAAESIMIVVLTATMTHRLPSHRFVGLSLLALTGLYFAVGIAGSASASGSTPAGIALLGAGTFSAAIYVVLSGRVARLAPALWITAWQQSVALVLVALVTVALHFSGTTHAAAGGQLSHDSHATASVLFLCAAAGLLQFALPFSLYMIALQRLSANAAGALLLLTPVVGLIEAHAFLGEQLTGRQWTGSVVALAAVAGLGIIGTGTKKRRSHSPVDISSGSISSPSLQRDI